VKTQLEVPICARLRQKQESAWADAWLEQTFEAKDREIARLHLEGQKPREIAEVLGLTPKTVSNRLVEVRKRCSRPGDWVQPLASGRFKVRCDGS
jgi:DNA-directed RNA polymerase specialized sigma24 family protein